MGHKWDFLYLVHRFIVIYCVLLCLMCFIANKTVYTKSMLRLVNIVSLIIIMIYVRRIRRPAVFSLYAAVIMYMSYDATAGLRMGNKWDFVKPSTL